LSCLVNATATSLIYTLSLHDALPIYHHERQAHLLGELAAQEGGMLRDRHGLDLPRPLAEQPLRAEQQHQDEDHQAEGVAIVVGEDRKSTRLNSSHVKISYAVFCLKKK